MKKTIVKIFRTIAKPFFKRGIGGLVPVKMFCQLLLKILNPINLEGDKFYVNPVDGIDFITGKYQKPVREIFRKEIKKRDTVVDIGANTGYLTLLAAKFVGKEGKVFAFEAEPNNFALLEKNIKTNNYENIFPLQKAVTDKTGKSKLYLREGTKYHRLYGSKDQKFVLVETIKLDDFFGSENYKVDFINIDIVGGEGMALQGMISLLKKNPAIKLIMDFSPERIEGTGLNPIDCLKALTNLGFKIWRQDKENFYSIEKIETLVQDKKTKTLFCKR